jgi:hypothetical protein
MKCRVLLLAAILLVPVLPAQAQTPRTLSYQGILTDSTGSAVPDGSYSVTFRLYETSTGGSSLWQETRTAQTAMGVLSSILGEVAPLTLAFDRQYWLGVQIGASPELTPRMALTASAYSIRSARADTADVSLSGAGPWSVRGDTVTYAAGNVGVGTDTPQAVLHVNGTGWFQGDRTPLPPAAGAGVALGSSGENGYLFGFDYASFTPRNLLLQNPGGNVGIGTLFPTGGRLHVDGGSSTAMYSTSTGGIGAYAVSGTNAAVYGYSTGDYGVDGRSFNSIGVYGQSYSGGGMWATGPYIGIQANATGSDANRQAVRGDNGGSATGYAGLFYGNTWVAGTFYKNAGAFRIDHPLDPANKYLNHSFVESPDMKNIHDGVITTGADGLATVDLPAWFETLNRDFRYQLTVLGQFAQAIVRNEIKDNRFTIQTDKPGVRVSWQVTGIRQDPYAEAHRIPVEEDKPADARGRYVYPEGYGRPQALSIPGGLPSMSTLPTAPSERPGPAAGGSRGDEPGRPR